MIAKPITVLFLCTGNSARSILAEATLNHLGKGRFIAHSAGSRPRGRVHRNTLWQLNAAGIATEGLHSKSLDGMTGADAPRFDIVVTVCDRAADEICPVLFGDFVLTHWGMADPVASHGDEVVRRSAFAQTHRELTYRIEQLIALPVESLDRDALKSRLDAIGTSSPARGTEAAA